MGLYEFELYAHNTVYVRVLSNVNVKKKKKKTVMYVCIIATCTLSS